MAPRSESGVEPRTESGLECLSPPAIALHRSWTTIEIVEESVDADALLNRIGSPHWIVDHVVVGHARPKLLRSYMPTLPLGEARDALQKWGDERPLSLNAYRASGERYPEERCLFRAARP